MYDVQHIIHNEKHSGNGLLSESVFNIMLLGMNILVEYMEELADNQEEYIIDEDIYEMLEHDRRFMSYYYNELDKVGD
jgi:hypothetical protein